MKNENSNTPNKGVSFWLVLGILLGPAILMLPLGFFILNSAVGEPGIYILYALPVVAGITAAALAFKEGLQAKRERKPSWSEGGILGVSILIGIAATIVSAAIMYGTCFASLSILLRDLYPR